MIDFDFSIPTKVLFGVGKLDELKREKLPGKLALVVVSAGDAMKEKGYDPINQIVGYLISGDPTYITSFNNARYLIRMLERDELLEELVRFYVNAPEHKAQTELER